MFGWPASWEIRGPGLLGCGFLEECQKTTWAWGQICVPLCCFAEFLAAQGYWILDSKPRQWLVRLALVLLVMVLRGLKFCVLRNRRWSRLSKTPALSRFKGSREGL